MAEGRGGYRAPSKPAPASGPGKLSRRTDGGPQPVRALTDAAYGEQQAFREQQQAAPMAGGTTPAAAGPAPADLSNIVPFNANTMRPDEAITSGAADGEGPGLESLGLGTEDNGVEYLRRLLPMFEAAASLPSAGPEFRQFVRRLRASS